MIDVLEPYEGELLFSWIIRMADWNGVFIAGGDDGGWEYKKTLLGKNTCRYPKMFIESYLEELVKRVNLPNSAFFKSRDCIVENMTIYPFYISFLSEKDKKIVFKKLEDIESGKKTYEAVKGFVPSPYTFRKQKGYLKYCPECIKQQGYFLKREHQILNNKFCSEHEKVLRGYHYEQNWNHLNFIGKMKENPQLLDEIEYVGKAPELYIKLSKMIHSIFENGFQDSLPVLQAKIRGKMKELKYLSPFNYFYDYKEVYEGLGCEAVYPDIHESENELHLSIFRGKQQCSINPINYLFLIERLFGSLESYYDYLFKQEELEVPKYGGKMRQAVFANFGHRYLSSKEYGLCFGRKEKQIRNYCVDGRIQGAKQVNGVWFIPEAAPFPKDMSYK